jgi:hypothetical protein
MSAANLPLKRVLSSAFRESGRTDVVKIDVLTVADGDVISLTFETKDSPWRQGVWLKTDGFLVVSHRQCAGVQLWQDTAPDHVLIQCHTSNGCLHVYNIWDRGRGAESQSWTSGMLVEDLPNGRRYRCNDIGFETDFTKLVFRIERVSSVT